MQNNHECLEEHAKTMPRSEVMSEGSCSHIIYSFQILQNCIVPSDQFLYIKSILEFFIL